MAQVEVMDIDQEFQLLDFAEEILLKIFSFFDDSTLIKSSKVCRRFKKTAEVAVQDKYNGNENYEHNFYQLKEYPGNANDQRVQHEPFFSTFAYQIKAVQIIFNDDEENIRQDNWMIRLIMEYCPNVLKLMLSYDGPDYGTVSDLEQILSRLSQLRFLQLSDINPNNSRWSKYFYPLLTEIVFSYVDNLDLQTVRSFLSNNPQLESFKSFGLNHVKFAAFDGSNLRELVLESEDLSMFFEDSPHVQMKMLKEISIENSSIDLFKKLAAGCENIETLKVFSVYDLIKITETQINALRSFKQMSSLKLDGVRLSADQVKKIITQTPNLFKFACTCADDIPIDDVKDIVLHGNSKLGKIRLRLNFKNIKPSNLDWEFHNWFKNNAKSDLQLVLFVNKAPVGPMSNKFIVTKEKITRNGVLVYWHDYEQSCNHFGQSKVEFLQLKDKCFEKIIEYLDQSEKLALYQTCSRMQKLIEPMFQQEYADNSFTLQCDSPLTENFIRYFGKFMKNITFGSDRQCDNIDGRCTFHWELIHKYCCVALTYLTVEHSFISQHISFMGVKKILLPNLKKLKFTGSINHVQKARTVLYPHLIYSFCPNLEHLEFGNGIVMIDFVDMDFDVWLSNLTTLRIERYTTTWIEFLRALNDNAHRNLCDLTLQNLRDVVNGRLQYELDNAVVNKIVRFPNLKSLDLLLGGYENVNMKFLLESCSKLEVLSIFMESSIPYEIFENITKSCNKLETLNIVVKRSVNEFWYLDEVRECFPPKIVIKVYEVYNDVNFTKGLIQDEEWLDGYKNYCSSVHD